MTGGTLDNQWAAHYCDSLKLSESFLFLYLYFGFSQEMEDLVNLGFPVPFTGVSKASVGYFISELCAIANIQRRLSGVFLVRHV